MSGNLKALGLALFACLAMSGVVSASASAEEFVFLSEESTTTLTGAQGAGTDDVFTTAVGTVTCTETAYTGTATGFEATEVELAPTYTGCTAAGLTTTVKANGCKYRFKTGTVAGETMPGTVDVVCPAEKTITAEVLLFGTPVCTVKVPAQNGLGTVTYTTSGINEEAKISAVVSIEEKLAYSYSGSCGTGSAGNGSFTGSGLVAGEVSGATGIAVGRKNLTLEVVFKSNSVNFKGHAKNAETPFTIENKGALKVRLGENTIDADDGHYEITKSGSCTAKGDVNSDLNSGEKCTAYVKWISGTKVLLRSYVLKFGPKGDPKQHTIRGDIFNQ